MANRFYTILVIPEKTARVKRLIIPSWIIRSSAIGLAFTVLLGGMMVFDYWYVMSQISENKQLKMENRRLRQQVQIFQNKIATVESTMDRVRTFATRLKVILHVEDSGAPPVQAKLPSATLPLSADATQEAPTPGQAQASGAGVTPVSDEPSVSTAAMAPLVGASKEAVKSVLKTEVQDPETAELQRDYVTLDDRITRITQEAFQTEEQLQDQYEILYNKKAFLAALPTRQPAPGYFTSGFGVRASPYGGRVKMHEGLDIANRPGTMIRTPADGEVVFAAPKAGYGLTVVVNHGYGIETWYGHLRKFLVTKGTVLKRGDKIAMLGNSGRSTGPHVHYEVRVRGYPVDPRSYIIEDPTP